MRRRFNLRTPFIARSMWITLADALELAAVAVPEAEELRPVLDDGTEGPPMIGRVHPLLGPMWLATEGAGR